MKMTKNYTTVGVIISQFDRFEDMINQKDELITTEYNPIVYYGENYNAPEKFKRYLSKKYCIIYRYA